MTEEQRFYEQLERVYYSIKHTNSKPKLVYYLKIEGFSESEIKKLIRISKESYERCQIKPK